MKRKIHFHVPQIASPVPEKMFEANEPTEKETTAEEEQEEQDKEDEEEQEEEFPEEADGLLQEVWNVAGLLEEELERSLVEQHVADLHAEELEQEAVEEEAVAEEEEEVEEDEEEEEELKDSNGWFPQFAPEAVVGVASAAQYDLDELWNPFMSDGGEDQVNIIFSLIAFLELVRKSNPSTAKVLAI